MLAKGVKRKRSEEEADPPSSSLFSLSVSKLHQSLQRIEPNLRRLVLVANTLRRLQGEMQPAPLVLNEAALPAVEASSVSRHGAGGVPACTLLDTCRSPLPSPSPASHVDELLFSSMDLSVFSTLLEDLNATEGLGDSLSPSLVQPEGLFSPESARTSPPGPPTPLEILGPGGYLLEDGLEDIFEDIDTSMYDSSFWSPISLPGLKEGSSSPVQERSDLADLDYLMDILVEAQEL
ncbi:SERTA domain-containing protein 1 [Pogona vitticeps]